MDLNLFYNEELNFINIILAFVVHDEKHLKEAVNTYWDDHNITFWDTSNIKDMTKLFSGK